MKHLHKLKKDAKGMISLFILLLMLPTIVFTGIMVDFSRINMAHVQANNAAYLAATSVLTHFDGLLLDVYGLLAVSQRDRPAMETFATNVARTSLGLNNDGGRAFSPSFDLIGPGIGPSSANVTIGPTVWQYSLNNMAYLRYQIMRYMAYRAPLSLFNLEQQVREMEDLNEQGTAPTLEQIQNEINFIDDFYLPLLADVGELHSVYYDLRTRYTEIERNINTLVSQINEWEENIATERAREVPNTLAISHYIGLINGAINVLYNEGFNNIHALAEDAETKGHGSSGFSSKRQAAIDELKTNTNNRYSEAFINLMTNESNGILITLGGADAPTLVSAGLPAQTTEFVNTNRERLREHTAGSGPMDFTFFPFPARSAINNAIPYDFVSGGDDEEPPESRRVRNFLREASGGEVSVSWMNLFARELNPFRRPSINSLVNSFTGSIISTLQPHNPHNLSNLTIPSPYRSGAANRPNEGFDSGLIELFARMLVTEYAVSMFSNYTTNRRIGSDGQRITQDYTFSGIPMDRRMNYFFGAELEFLLTGRYNAEDAFLEAVRNLTTILVGRNMIAFFKSDAFTDFKAIKAIPVAGWVLAPIYMAVAVVFETVLDIDTLLSGRRVPLLKTGNAWRMSLAGMVGTNNPWNTSFPHFKRNNPNAGMGPAGAWYYRDYLRVRLLLVNPATLERRIATLIEVNMNYHINLQNGQQGLPPAREHFRLDRAYVLAEATVNVHIPNFFIQMPFLGGSRGTQFQVRAVRGY